MITEIRHKLVGCPAVILVVAVQQEILKLLYDLIADVATFPSFGFSNFHLTFQVNLENVRCA